jgi:hypothetical protein
MAISHQKKTVEVREGLTARLMDCTNDGLVLFMRKFLQKSANRHCHK